MISLLKKGADATTLIPTAAGDNTALHIITQYADIKVLQEVMLTPEADINILNSRGMSPLHLAIFIQDLNKVKYLISLGSDPYQPSKAGWTPLGWSVFMGHGKLTKTLLECGVRYTKCTLTNQHLSVDASSPLHSAVKQGNLQIIKHLIYAGAEPDEVNEAGETPLDVANNTNVIELLIKSGAKEWKKGNLRDAEIKEIIKDIGVLPSFRKSSESSVSTACSTPKPAAKRSGYYNTLGKLK